MSRITNLKAFVPKLNQIGKIETITGLVDGSKITASFHNGKLESVFLDDGNDTKVDKALVNQISDFYALISRASFHFYVPFTPNAADAHPQQLRSDMMNN
jgi:tricorn protease-like protein